MTEISYFVLASYLVRYRDNPRMLLLGMYSATLLKLLVIWLEWAWAMGQVK